MTQRILSDAINRVTAVGQPISADGIIMACQKRGIEIIGKGGKLIQATLLRKRINHYLSGQKKSGLFRSVGLGVYERLPVPAEHASDPLPTPTKKTPKQRLPKSTDQPVTALTTKMPPILDTDEAIALLLPVWEQEERAKLDAIEIAERQKIRERLVRERHERALGGVPPALEPVRSAPLPAAEPQHLNERQVLPEIQWNGSDPR